MDLTPFSQFGLICIQAALRLTRLDGEPFALFGGSSGYKIAAARACEKIQPGVFYARWAFFLGFFNVPKVERATGFAATNLQGALAFAICQLIIRVDLRKKMSPRKWNYIIIF